MATLGVLNPTLLDFERSLDPDGKVGVTIEIMNQTNEILDDATFVEANGITGHVVTVRTGLPVPTWRKLYGGVPPNKSTRAKVQEGIGMLEDYNEVDKALADLNNNTQAFRLSEAKATIEGMSQEYAETLFLGNSGTEPEAFTGFGPRFNLTTAENGSNVILAGGSGADNTSIWLVVWSPETVFCIYPKGSSSGLKQTDKGQVTIEDASNGSNTGRMEGYRMHFRWDVGLCVADWRYVVRIANIDLSDLLITAATGANLLDLMVQAIELVPNINAGRAVFYVNRTIKSWLRRQMIEKVKSSTLSMENIMGKHVMVLDGIPVKRVDKIGIAETLVS